MDGHPEITFNDNEYYDSIKKLVADLWNRWTYVCKLNSLLSTLQVRSNFYREEHHLKGAIIPKGILERITPVQDDTSDMKGMKDAIWKRDVESLMQLADVAHQLKKHFTGLVRSFGHKKLARSYELLNRRVEFEQRYIEEYDKQIDTIDEIFRELERKKRESPESFNKAVSYACYCITADDIHIRGQMNETSYRRMFGSTICPAAVFC